MSKLTKLLFKPKLFFIDMIKKREGTLPKVKTAAIKTKDNLVSCAILEFLPYVPVKFIIHTGESDKFGKAHLNQWLPLFEAEKVLVLVLVRNYDLYKWVRQQYPKIMCVFAKDVISVDKVLNKCESANTIFYLSNTGNLIHSLRRNDRTHIFLGHGDSNKFASAHKFFRVYDEVWVSGQAHIDRFKCQGFDTKHIVFRKVGRPLLRPNVELCDQIAWKDRKPSRVLIAPSWEGVVDVDNTSSVTHIPEILKYLTDTEFEVTLKFHPANGTRLSKFKDVEANAVALSRENNKLTVIDKTAKFEDCLGPFSVCMGDYSATITDFLSCNCPIILFKPHDGVRVSSSGISYEDFCYVWTNLDELKNIFNMLSQEDPKLKNREMAREYYLGISQIRGNTFVRLLKEM